MNKAKIFNYFSIAAKSALSKEDRRHFLFCALGVRNDGVIVKSLNSPTEFPNRLIHAEARVCKKLDYYADVYVTRVRLDTYDFGLSRPCKSCFKALLHKKVRRVYYTISPNKFGIWDLETGTEREMSFL